MQITLLHDNVLVQVTEASKTSAGGIVLPGAINNKQQGVVIAVGEGSWLPSGVQKPLAVEKGDRVLFRHEHEGTPVTLNGEDYIVFRESALLGIIHNEAE